MDQLNNDSENELSKTLITNKSHNFVDSESGQKPSDAFDLEYYFERFYP